VRKVEVIKRIFNSNKNGYDRVVNYIGVFHCWGLEEDGEGGSYTAAVVEKDDGRVNLVYAGDVRFTEEGEI